MVPTLPLVLAIAVALQLCLLTAPIAAASQRNILLDNEGRLHINADDVVILNASFRALLDQLQAFNATLQQDIQTRNQQIADLLGPIPFNATEHD
jgi:Tfp pilus assembly protein PilN